MAREVDLGSIAGPQGPKGATGATGASGPQGKQGPQGPKGDKGDTIFQLEVDSAGNLYAIYQDGTTPPQFEFESATGNLYLVVPD